MQLCESLMGLFATGTIIVFRKPDIRLQIVVQSLSVPALNSVRTECGVSRNVNVFGQGETRTEVPRSNLCF
jgi:hypothetical protein